MHQSCRAISLSVVAAALLIFAPLAFRAAYFPDDPTTLILNAQLADGAGTPLREAALRIRGNRIAAIGKLSPALGERVIDAHGLVLAPGFIDIHNHSIDDLDSDPLGETQIAQGITTAVQGPDGDSPWPIKDWIEHRSKNPAAFNVAVFAGHATIREQVMGKDFKRIATPQEIEKMAQLAWQMGSTALAIARGYVGVMNGPKMTAEEAWPRVKAIAERMHAEGLVHAQPLDNDLYLLLRK